MTSQPVKAQAWLVGNLDVAVLSVNLVIGIKALLLVMAGLYGLSLLTRPSAEKHKLT